MENETFMHVVRAGRDSNFYQEYSEIYNHERKSFDLQKK
jgi:hypothetical protein